MRLVLVQKILPECVAYPRTYIVLAGYVARGLVGRVFIISIGFHEDRAIRRLMESSATKGDRVYLITASRTQAVLRAYESLVALCRKLGLPDPELVEVPTGLYDGIARLLSVLSSSDSEVVLDLSGGMRYLAAYALVALFISGRSATVYVQPESGEGSDVVIPAKLFSVARDPPKGVDLLVLRAVHDLEGSTVEELSKSVSRSAKTVANSISKLTKMGLVVRRGRRGSLHLTELGRLAVKLLGGASVSTSSQSPS
ncbi:MAG: CRISPR-associated CARF protein Csa3 [Sulfolobales archaeon]